MKQNSKIEKKIAWLEEKHADQSTLVDCMSHESTESLNLRAAKKKKLALKDKIEELKKQL